MSPELQEALARSRRWWETASEEEIEVMLKAQRESWVRAMSTPCEHGELDFEQCGECVAAAIQRNRDRDATLAETNADSAPGEASQPGPEGDRL